MIEMTNKNAVFHDGTQDRFAEVIDRMCSKFDNFAKENKILIENVMKSFQCTSVDPNKKFIIHFLGYAPAIFNYRRYRFYNYLRTHCSDDIEVFPIFTEYIPTSIILKVCTQAVACIVSHPKDAAKYFKLLPENCPIYYDKTDAWNYDDSEVINRASVLTCSAKYIYDSFPDEAKKRATLIINGAASDKLAEPTKKFTKTTAVYAGIYLRKLDLSILYKLYTKNKDINFHIFCREAQVGDEIDNQIFARMQEDAKKHNTNLFLHTPVEYEALIDFMSHCHIGILPLKADAEWSKGMFSLKVFDYLIAGLPTWYVNSINYTDFDDKICFNGNKYTLQQTIDTFKLTDAEKNSVLTENCWNNKFDKICELYDLKKYFKI